MLSLYFVEYSQYLKAFHIEAADINVIYILCHVQYFCKIRIFEETDEVGFEVLTEACIKMAIFWVVRPCNPTEFTDVSEVLALSIISVISTSETSINFYQTTRRYSPEDGHLKN
jgi:hypothetical protein